jgi:hypothetical protein
MPPLPFRSATGPEVRATEARGPRYPLPAQASGLVGTARTLDALAKDGAASAAQADAPSRSGTSIT